MPARAERRDAPTRQTPLAAALAQRRRRRHGPPQPMRLGEAAPCLGSAWHHWRRHRPAPPSSAAARRAAPTPGDAIDLRARPAAKQVAHGQRPIRAAQKSCAAFSSRLTTRGEIPKCRATSCKGISCTRTAIRISRRRAHGVDHAGQGLQLGPPPSPAAPDRDSGPPVRRPADPVPCRSSGDAPNGYDPRRRSTPSASHRPAACSPPAASRRAATVPRRSQVSCSASPARSAEPSRCVRRRLQGRHSAARSGRATRRILERSFALRGGASWGALAQSAGLRLSRGNTSTT